MGAGKSKVYDQLWVDLLECSGPTEERCCMVEHSGECQAGKVLITGEQGPLAEVF